MLDTANSKKRKSFFNFGKASPLPKSEQVVLDNTYYEEISNLTKAGGWSVNFVEKTSFFDTQARRILEVPEYYTPSLKDGYKFYAEEHRDLATNLFFGCAQGTPFSAEIKMTTYTNKVFWAKAYGRPIYSDKQEIIGIRGAFQDITLEKEKEIRLQQSLHIIEAHNKRLYDFAHAVSHNLRSHASNLQLSATLFDTDNLNANQLELLGNFENLGKSLDDTLSDLNEIVTLKNPSSLDIEKVEFSDVLRKAQASMLEKIRQSRCTFFTDFSEIEAIEYIPSYLENILRSLINNAIQFKHPDRDPEVTIFTYQENKKSYLVIKDNGLGIDLDMYGDQVFKMYSTFHDSGNGQGISLFLIKNQVEALGGQITVESKLGKYTKFTIQLGT